MTSPVTAPPDATRPTLLAAALCRTIDAHMARYPTLGWQGVNVAMLMAERAVYEAERLEAEATRPQHPQHSHQEPVTYDCP